ncbi:PREDICTED: biogenesis of lysosome-related organelles complex 1 subunit 5 [Ceratotherium simum simum]|uniref:Biogenesis of lysosome-related organelles complex 1 subunit 5 n=1 Tax=Ceratotherium simum simum TaxID=73337 RepID=A0ABM1CXJ7_CERSS|nr:PREDICTED: biogenesis of lysosome-related organelles complex 1 subunit 5 [Ceratotherium simum simum]
MSGGGTETPVGCEASPGGGDKKRDSLGTAGSPAHLIIKVSLESLMGRSESSSRNWEATSQAPTYELERLMELEQFVKLTDQNNFEEKRGLREMRVLENLKNMIHETNEHTLPKCRETMQENLNQVLKRLQAATDSVCRLQQREQERKKIHNDHLIASEKQHIIQWEDFMKEQHNRQSEVDEEHRKAMERLKEQYAEMEKELAKFSTF